MENIVMSTIVGTSSHIIFCRPFFVFYISFGHCVVCPISIYRIWSPLWLLQTVLVSECYLFRSWNRILIEQSSICVLGVSILSLPLIFFIGFRNCSYSVVFFIFHFKFWLQEIHKHIMSDKCLLTDDNCLHTRSMVNDSCYKTLHDHVTFTHVTWC